MDDETYNHTVEEFLKYVEKKKEEAMDNFVEKQIEKMKTGIGALAEITGIFYTSLGHVPGLDTEETDIDRHILTRAFIDSFLDHTFNPGGKNENNAE